MTPLPKSHFQTHYHCTQGRVLLAFPTTTTTGSNPVPSIQPIGFLSYSLLLSGSAPNILGGPTHPLLVYESLAIAPGARRNGLAKEMVKLAMEEAKMMAASGDNGRRTTAAGTDGRAAGEAKVMVRVWMKDGGKEEKVLEKLMKENGELKKEGRSGWWSGIV